MPRLKLFILISFVLTALTFFGQMWNTSSIAGARRAAIEPLSAPSGFSASDGDYADKIGVMWSTVRNATLYRIFRNTANDPSNAQQVGTTSANYFFDSTAVPDQNYFYWVRAENSGSVSNFSNFDSGFRAEGSFQSEIFSPLSPPPAPGGNPVSAAKAYLGKVLFWDEQLSSTLTVSCGTCHRPSSGGSDPRTAVNDDRSRNPGFDGVFNTADDVFGSPGVPHNNLDGTYSPAENFGFREQVTSRKSPSYINAGLTFNGSFWDGRASNTFRDPLTAAILLTDWAAYESQVLFPPVSDSEMGHQDRNWNQVALQISQAKPLALAGNIPRSLSAWINGRTYPQLFEDAFGSPDVTPSRIAFAIASHERTLFSDRAPLDRYAAGIEPLTAQEDRGREIFVSVQCGFCHGGPLLSDQNFNNIGVRPQNEDAGRGAISGNASDNARFKTPSLRNVELRAPYMHNGRFETLEEVVEFYDRGGDFNAANINRGLIRPLNLTAGQKADLVAFLKRPLTDPRVKDELPPFDRPQLYTESDRVPEISGEGRAGSGGSIPKIVAIEPAILGNPKFTVAVSDALSGANAVLVIDANDPGIGTSIPANGAFARISANISGAGFGSVSLPIPDDPALNGQTFYGRWYITDPGAVNGFSVTQFFRFKVFAAASTASRNTPFDFDGDGKTDLSIFRPAPGEWWYSQSADGGSRAFQFGAFADRVVPADFTGDGKTDAAFFRPATGEWFVLRSEDSTFYSFPFGANGDIPIAGDFDADGKADAGVFRATGSTWYVAKSSGGILIRQFGADGDRPVAADYDGDGKTDIAIFRPNGVSGAEWWVQRSSDETAFAVQFGAPNDKAVPADFTGDGKADIAFFRPADGNWFILRSEDFSFYAFPFGTGGDLPVAGDYDGDGKTDPAVFRPTGSNWYVNRSTSGILIRQFGISGDQPLPNAFVPSK